MSNCGNSSNRLSGPAHNMVNAWLVDRARNNLAIEAKDGWRKIDMGAVNNTYAGIRGLTGVAMTDEERDTAFSMLNMAAYRR